jgi:type VI secretion system protein ImpJ
MRQMQGVLWTKGLLLSPQHLQLHDRYFEDQLGFQMGSLAKYPWGFSTLNVDAEALEGGILSVPRASGIMEDGLLFDFPEADLAPDSKSLDDYWRPDQGSMMAYLAIPEFRVGDRNVDPDGDSTRTRFTAEVSYRRDENTGLAERPVEVARKNFKFLVEGESLEGHTALPLARILRDGSGVLSLDPTFVPPLLDFSVSDHLISIVKRLDSILMGKSAGLGKLRRERSAGLAGFGAADIPNFWLLYTVNSHLPEIRHLLASAPHHPQELYALLLSLAGALTTFSSNVNPGDLPVYRQDDLSGCFTALDEVLRNLLDTVIATNAVSIRLETVEASVYGASIEEERHLRAVQAYLAVRSEIPDSELIERAPGLIKVASRDEIQRLFHQSVSGVGLGYVSEPPRALPVKLDYRYFRLDLADPLWQTVLRSRSIAVWVASEIPDPELELVLILPPDEG